MIFDHYLNPILLTVGPFSVRYYGLFIVLGILSCLLLWRVLLKNNKAKFEVLFDLLVWLIVGGVIGARLGHIIFYELSYYLANPLEIIMIHRGGLSSHGLTIGLVITFFLFVRIKKIQVKQILDLVILPLPILIFLIRCANFLNSEIVGRATGGEWGVRFYAFEASPILRHPSQLYEAMLGILILPVILWSYSHFNLKKKQPYITFWLFIALYFGSRFVVEYLKEYQTLEPGSYLTMGQYLSIPFVVIAIIALVILLKKPFKA